MFSVQLINLLGASLSVARDSSCTAPSWFISPLKATLFSCLWGIDNIGEALWCLLVAVSSVNWLSWLVTVLVQSCYNNSRDPIIFNDRFKWLKVRGGWGWLCRSLRNFMNFSCVAFSDHNDAYFISQCICMGHVIPLSASSDWHSEMVPTVVHLSFKCHKN